MRHTTKAFISIFFRYCLFAALIFLTDNVRSQDQQGRNLEIYILMGQSNMAGRGPITPDLKDDGNDSVFVLNREMQWVLARHPLHFDKPSVAGVGPGLAFGIKMAKAHQKARIGLVPCAVGGTKIERWLPGAYDPVTKTHPYDDAAVRIKAAMQYGTVKGVIWHQGEANSEPQQAKIYLEQLSQLIIRVRRLTGNANLPFVAGELGSFYPESKNLNPQLRLLPENMAFTDVVSSRGLTDKGDKVHFDGSSANRLGRRYAKKMLGLQTRWMRMYARTTQKSELRDLCFHKAPLRSLSHCLFLPFF